MRSTFKILFYVKRSAPLRNGELPVMGRITINGLRAQFSTHLSVASDQWHLRPDRCANRRLNDRLAALRLRIESSFDLLSLRHESVTPQMVRDHFTGSHRDRRTLLWFFDRHNEAFSRRVGVTRSASTYKKYRCVRAHVADFIRSRYGLEDLMFGRLDRDFITGFHAWIRRQLGRRKNTAWVYMIALKHILRLARVEGYLDKDLFADYKLHHQTVVREYLTADEIARVMALQLACPTLLRVRDAFLFSCFTGLSYVDLRNLRPTDIQEQNGRRWISITRQKTGAEVQVQLFDTSQAILDRQRVRADDGFFFPLPGNGWCNRCLRRIMLCAGIDRRVTLHSARHTFAMTVLMDEGIGLEVVSKLLGHRNIKTTQLYASVTRRRMEGELERLSERIGVRYADPVPQPASGQTPSAAPMSGGDGCDS